MNRKNKWSTSYQYKMMLNDHFLMKSKHLSYCCSLYLMSLVFLVAAFSFSLLFSKSTVTYLLVSLIYSDYNLRSFSELQVTCFRRHIWRLFRLYFLNGFSFSTSFNPFLCDSNCMYVINFWYCPIAPWSPIFHYLQIGYILFLWIYNHWLFFFSSSK